MGKGIAIAGIWIGYGIAIWSIGQSPHMTAGGLVMASVIGAMIAGVSSIFVS